MTKRDRQRTFRRLLKQLGWNCTQAGNYLRVNPATVRAWHAGLEGVPLKRLDAIQEKVWNHEGVFT
jgi:hypothetical protein